MELTTTLCQIIIRELVLKHGILNIFVTKQRLDLLQVKC